MIYNVCLPASSGTLSSAQGAVLYMRPVLMTHMKLVLGIPLCCARVVGRVCDDDDDDDDEFIEAEGIGVEALLSFEIFVFEGIGVEALLPFDKSVVT